MKRTPNNASALAHAGALIVPLLLAACGGGGGGDADTTSTTAPPLSLTITTTNAKSASADAMDNALTAASSSSATAVNLLKSKAVPGPGGVPGLLQTATALARLAPAKGKAKAKAAISESIDCPLGGSIVAVGSIAYPSALVAGDTLSLTALNCKMTIDSSTVTMSGALSLSVNSGSMGDTAPFNVDMSFSAVDFRTQVGADSITVTGDERMVWNLTSPSAQTRQTSGTSYALTSVIAGKTRSTTWRNYEQTITLAGTQLTSQLSAQVETLNSRLGSTPVTYQITTPAPLVTSVITGDISSGSVLATGNRSAVRITFTGTDSVELQVDANGDGTYEQTLTSTMDELATLL